MTGPIIVFLTFAALCGLAMWLGWFWSAVVLGLVTFCCGVGVFDLVRRERGH